MVESAKYSASLDINISSCQVAVMFYPFISTQVELI